MECQQDTNLFGFCFRELVLFYLILRKNRAIALEISTKNGDKNRKLSEVKYWTVILI